MNVMIPMIFIYLLTLLLFTVPELQAQNLVPNPSFEIFVKCPKDYNVNYRKELLPGWYMATGGTPDYFNSCTRIQVGVPQNFMGSCFAKDGNAYVGLMLLLDPPNDSVAPAKTNYREYIEARLNEPLTKGQFYLVTFYFSVGPYSTYAVNRLGAFFSEKRIGNRRSTRTLNYKPQVCMDSTKILTERQNWFAVSDTFLSNGNEQYITIGNFYDDKRTRYKTLNLEGISKVQQARIADNRIAYYFIDLVSVIKIDK